MTLGEVLESCKLPESCKLHTCNKGSGVSGLWKREAFQILNNMENGQIYESLPRTSAEDVAFDTMDEVIIEEEDYYIDGTSDSDNDSDASLEDSIENYELY